MQYKQSIFKRTALSAAIVATLGLTACGGGGGSSSTDGDTSSFSSATTSGTAAKGIISGGIVTATEITSGNEVGSALTDTGGEYQLTIGSNYQGGPIQLAITADADTQMKCDATAGCGTRADDISDSDTNIDFGEWYKPGEGGIQMRALLPSASNGAAISASITPFTEMAAIRAEQDGISEESIAAANSVVTSLLGVNILNTPPVDITALPTDASATEIAYAALASAAANLSAIDSETGVIDVQAGIDALATALSDNGIVANDDDTDESVISLQDILAAATATLHSADVEDTSGVLNELQEDIQGAGEDGLVNPDPVDTATLSNVEKAKALVEDFRTYAMDLDATISDPSFGGQFAQEVELTSLLLNNDDSSNPLYVFDMVSNVGQYPWEYFEVDYEVANGQVSYEFSEADDYPFKSGSAIYTYSWNEETHVWQDKVEFINAVTIVGEHTVNMVFDSSGTYTGQSVYNEETRTTVGDSEETINSDIVGTIVSANNRLTVNSGNFENWDDSYRSTYFDDGTIYLSEDEGEYRIETSVSANGSLEILNEGASTPILFEGELALKSFNRETYFGSYSSNYETYDSSYSNYSTDVTYLESASFDGTLSLGTEVIAINANAAMPNAAEFFAMEDGSTIETEGQWLQMNAGIGITIDTASLSGVSLNVSAARTAFDAAEAQIRLSHNERSLLVSFATALTADGMPGALGDAMNLTLGEAAGDITVTDANGTSLVITPPATDEAGVIGYVVIDGIAVATIEQTEDGLIKTSYSDGTFEIY